MSTEIDNGSPTIGCMDKGHYYSHRKMYVNEFGKMPCVFMKRIENSIYSIDFSKINRDFIKETFPKYKSVFDIYENIYRVEGYDGEPEKDENGNDKYEINYDQTYTLDGNIYSNIVLIDKKKKILICADFTMCEIYFDIDAKFDYESILDDVYDKLPKKENEKDKNQPHVDIVAFDDGYYTITAKINDVKIDLDKNYNDDFKEAYKNILAFLNHDNRKSGLVILNGKSGTGKTYFIRHLINEVKLKYVIIPPNVATHLSSPELMSFLMRMRDSIFILEDCEQVIMDRKNNTFSSAVSSILNMTDGIMSDVFNLKFICTFNCDISLIDEAILRKGRCFVNYEFRPLESDKVQKIMEEDLNVHLDSYKDMTLADIYNYDPNEYVTTKKNRIGF